MLVFNQDRAKLKWEDLKIIAMSLRAGKSCPVFEIDKMEGVYFKKALMVEKGELEGWLKRQ